jgi:hypothetical protein
MLRNAGENGLTNTQLKDFCIRWDARVRELYQKGYVIEVVSLGNGVYQYVLKSEPEVVPPKPQKAIHMLMEEIQQRFDGSVTSSELMELLKDKGLNIVRKHGAHKQVVN